MPLAKVKDEKGMKRVEKVSQRRYLSGLSWHTPVCCRPCAEAAGYFAGRSLRYDTSELIVWVEARPPKVCRKKCVPWPRVSVKLSKHRKAADGLGTRLPDLDRSASTLHRRAAADAASRAVRNRTTGVLYVLDEPSIGLHPSNIVGLTGVLQDLCC